MNEKKSPNLSLLLCATVAALLLPSMASAQSNTIYCGPTQKAYVFYQPLPTIPLIGSTGGALKGTLYTVSQQVRMPARAPGAGVGADNPVCYAQWVRAYQKDAPATWNPSSSTITNPMPGPVLRARVGDLVELTFLNAIDAAKFPLADHGCDQTTNYPGTGPGADVYPDCFADSVYTNVHYHGTHTNPNTTGDNVFLIINPSPRATDGTNTPFITADSVKDAFKDFFDECEMQLKPATGPKIWPLYWDEIPMTTQTLLLNNVKAYGQPTWYQSDLDAIKKGKWPQYYASAYPYCFKLPAYTSSGWPPATNAAMTGAHTMGMGATEMPVEEAEDPQRPLIMGQAPGTHWYHAHKHGSTTVNVLNGMTGVFIIEGQYDDDINAFYGANWTRTQPVIVINQLGSLPPLVSGQRGAGPGPDFAVNGLLRPSISMPGNSVGMWRIANTSSRSGAFFIPPTGIQWMQLAQDGVQFNNTNYRSSENTSFEMAAGNRVDLLVKAPSYVSGGNNSYDVLVYPTVDPSDRPPARAATPVTLLRVVVTPNGPTMKFMPQAPTFPTFLADIAPSEVSGTQTLVFASSPNPNRGTPSSQTINGKKFDGSVGASVTLNKVQEWKIVNATYPPANGNQISHPFHIHINPFQIFEFFDPNALLPTAGNPAAGPGTVTITANPNDNINNATVNGTGTTFNTTFAVGDFIFINGQAPAQVIAIGGPSSLTINFSTSSTKAATYQSAIPLYTIFQPLPHPGQCYLNPNDNTTWHPCTNNVPQTNAVWWDVFPIPSGNIFFANTTTSYPIPGYFKMRSRFVDYFGQYVMHCHILAHEDRGMMTVVSVDPIQATYSHH
ncbi:MAG TPA: multicopper oxidase domain-containing protein [Thermoanaerobaculia bacterium]